MTLQLEALPERLLPWYAQNARQLPWRNTTQPYPVWLSEIMLQQTRVEAVKGYYQHFLQALPTIQALAKAEEELLLKLWEGLGYYSRVRNMKKAALQIMEHYNGSFPSTLEQVLALPGIGPYTAGAILSICFDQPVPAVDGNVLRVIARFCALEQSVSEPRVKKEIQTALAKVYPAGCCGTFTQSLMELGATVCLPNGEPSCAVCPLHTLCRAYAQSSCLRYPIKAEKKRRRSVDKTVFILLCGNRCALVKRPSEGLLAGLWQLPDVDEKCDAQAALDILSSWSLHPAELIKQVHRKHIFTHIQWEMDGYFVSCKAMPPRFVWPTLEEIRKSFSIPTAYRQFFEDMPEARGKESCG